MTHPHVLMLDVSGLPVEWIHWQTAATLYSRDKVRWEAGETSFVLTGGTRLDGSRSTMRINSIIATNDRSEKHGRTPRLTNAALFARDGYLCMFCGRKFSPNRLSRDHLIPRSRFGPDVWTNVVTACAGPRGCNARKGARTCEESGMFPLAVPYAPSHAELLLLYSSGRRILADQQAWLEACADKGRRPH